MHFTTSRLIKASIIMLIFSGVIFYLLSVTVLQTNPMMASSVMAPGENDGSKLVIEKQLSTDSAQTEKLVLSNQDKQLPSQTERPAQPDPSIEDKWKALSTRVVQLETLLSQLPVSKRFPEVKYRNYKDRKRILVTGGAGFVGSHLVDRLMLDGHEVTVADNFFTGRKINVEHWLGHENFELINHDIIEPLYLEVDQIYHLASPASPPHYMYNPVKTIKTNTVGTINMLGLAKRVKARLLFASTSEVYGDPEEHPQKETYWGHVNPDGPRACYDEAKRVAETMCYSYQKQSNVEVRVARIFNTYGPRMHMNDGRVVSNFILQALKNEPITIHGNGSQTRSFQYVSDLVSGLILLMNSNYSLPVNLGNPDEFKVVDFANKVKKMIGSTSSIQFLAAWQDDPQRRKPDISLAKKVLNWEPIVSVDNGLKWTIEYFKGELSNSNHTHRNRFLPKTDL